MAQSSSSIDPAQVAEDLEKLKILAKKMPEPLRTHVVAIAHHASRLLDFQDRMIKMTQKAIEDMQLDIKYKMFDLEATRRERDEWREYVDWLTSEGYNTEGDLDDD